METPTPCPNQPLHGDKHALFIATGRVYCECELVRPEDCDHSAHFVTYANGATECMVCGTLA